MANHAVFNVLSIDPGNNMGVVVSRMDTHQNTMSVLFAKTLVIDKAIRYDNPEMVARLSKDERKAIYLTKYLTGLIRAFNVDAIIYEAGFMARSVNAYKSLIFYGECIRKIALDYDWDMLVQSISPSRVKSLLGVVGTSDDKELMREGIRNHSNITLLNGICLDDLTEHAVDAIAIGHVSLFEFYLKQ